MGIMRWFLLAACVAFTSPCFAQEFQFTGNALLDGCKDQLSGNPSTATMIVYKGGICTGAVKILLDLGDSLDQSHRSCAPNNATMGQAMRVVIKYIEVHPENMNRSFTFLITEAMRQAWPCSK
jgi:Rap1a immunity proteins